MTIVVGGIIDHWIMDPNDETPTMDHGSIHKPWTKIISLIFWSWNFSLSLELTYETYLRLVH